MPILVLLSKSEQFYDLTAGLHWHLLFYAKINTAGLVVDCIHCMKVMHLQNACLHNIRPTISLFLVYFHNSLLYSNGLHFKDIMLSFSPKFGCSITKEAIIVLKENPFSDDQSTGLQLLDVLGIGSSWWVSFAIWCRLQYFATTFLMYFIPRHSTDAVIPGNTVQVDSWTTLCC